MDGDTNRPGLIRNTSRDGLSDPPGGIGRELITSPILELLHRLHQPHVALLNQIQERKATIRVLLRNGNDQPKIGLHHLCLGSHRLPDPLPQVPMMGKEFVPRQTRPVLNLLDLLFECFFTALLLAASRFRLMDRLQLRTFFL